jgi:hypothetical protein
MWRHSIDKLFASSSFKSFRDTESHCQNEELLYSAENEGQEEHDPIFMQNAQGENEGPTSSDKLKQ